MQEFVCDCHGKKFKTKMHLISHTYYWTNRQKYLRKENYIKQRITLNCIGCGKDFETYPSNKNRRYCSKKCFSDSCNSLIICKECGKEFLANKKAEREFCSKKCFYAYRGRNMSLEERQRRSKNWFEKIQPQLLAKVGGPNKFEQKVLSFVNQIGKGEFRFVGNGEVMVNGRSPDFINEKDKIVVLAHGIYWHLRKFKLEDTPEQRFKIESKDAKPFLDAGYDVIVIWEETDKKENLKFKGIFSHVKLNSEIVKEAFNHFDSELKDRIDLALSEI